MTRVAWTTTVDEDQLAALRRPRDGIVRERADGADRFVQEHGPFDAYERTLAVRPAGEAHEVAQQILFRLPRAVWPFPFRGLYRRALRTGAPSPWWAPPERPDAEAATVLGLLATASVALGYMGTLLTQTITFATDEFGSSRAAQGDTLAAVRAGVFLAIVLTTLADRRGRRQLLVVSGFVASIATAVGALAPNLLVLGLTQTVARGATTALAVIIAITVAEEMPAGSRAYGVSLLSMASALGAGLCLFALPLADLGDRWWRVLFLLPVVVMPVMRGVGRAMPESKRFRAPHDDVSMAGHGRRFWLLAASALLLAIFTSPASQFQNEFLRDERGFSGARIALFVILTNTPGAIGIVVGARIADIRGRRIVGAVGVTGGVLLTVLMFNAQGWPMWALSALGAIVGAAVVPALGVYGPELFPTSLRGRANGVITVLGVCGSVLGLVVVGRLADSWDRFGPGLALMAVGPLLMAALVLLAYPETAHVELEELNPEDAIALRAARGAVEGPG